jgi:ATP-binding cassette subfamily B protein
MGSEWAEMRPYNELPYRYYTPKERPKPLQRVEALSITYTYPGSKRGIHGVELRLEHGSFTVIAGRRGAGKTTLLRALLGLLPGVEGEIRWNGGLLTGALVATVRVTYLAQARPGLDEALRAEIARLLEGEAELLVVDDLSALLDTREERMLWDALFCRRLFGGWGACLAVSNRQPALCRADHILVLAEGRVVGEGRLEELLRTCAEMRGISGVAPEGFQAPQGL